MLRQMMLDSNASELQKRIQQQKLEAMLGLTEIMSCRRQSLLEYFDEALNEPCGNCDNCVTTPDSSNATEETRKALDCVYRTGQRFGVNYVIDVLTVKDNDRIGQFGHDKLSTYDIGNAISQTEWRVIFRQLIALGYLAVDADGHGALKLTEMARPLLKGEQELLLRKIARKQKQNVAKAKQVNEEISTVDRPLWEALRELRMSLAKEQGVPPYVIFHDATLKQMVIRRPSDLDEMAGLHGIGESKLKLYGQHFLQEIRKLNGEISGIS